MNKLFLSLLFVFAMIFPAMAAETKLTSLTLAVNGQAKMPIIISAAAAEDTKQVAAELSGYLQRMTGAAFEVKTGDGSSGIVLGTLKQFPNPALNKPLEIRRIYDGKEAYSIRTEPQRLLLIGATDLGASHAAYRLLEQLGCRRFFQSPAWDIVPSRPNLQASVNLDDRPVVLARRIQHLYAFDFDRFARLNDDKIYLRDALAWRRFNRLAQSFDIHTAHAHSSVGLMFKDEFDKHPEYWALVKGKRVPGNQLCLSNPEVRRLMAQYAVNTHKKYPGDMISLEAEDGGGFCECDECKKSTLSDLIFGAANAAARAVEAAYPGQGKMVGVMAYYSHSDPPSFKMEPNVHIPRATWFITSQMPREELDRIWPTRSDNLGIYEYFDMLQNGMEPLPGSRGADLTYIRTKIAAWAPHLTSFDIEGGGSWGPNGLGYYIANQVLWNPKADVDALLRDFYDKAFGPGAAPMQRFYERFNPGAHPRMSEHLFALGLRDVQEAGQLAKDRPDVQGRLDELKLMLYHQYLRWQIEHGSEDQKKELLHQLLVHNFRMRFTYMNSWWWVTMYGARRWARTYNEPSWSFVTAQYKQPWNDEPNYTHEDAEKLFQETLQHFQTVPIEEKQFSADLMPVKLGEGQSPASQIRASRGIQYAVYGGPDSPLTFEAMGVSAERDAASVTLSDATGKKVAEDVLPLHGEWKKFQFKLPRAGRYNLLLYSGYDTVVKLPAGLTAVADLPGTEAAFTMLSFENGTPLYFYVPKGTRNLSFYYSCSREFEIHDPSGKLAYKAEKLYPDGKHVSVPVPAGMDGRVWQIAEWGNIIQLYFYNAPNYLSHSSQQMLLPRELAEQDRLIISRHD